MTVFGMVTTQGSAAYTPHALASFFATTPIAPGDLFILIDNDGDFDCTKIPEPARKSVQVKKNSAPLSFAENVNQVMEIADRTDADLFFLNNDLIFTRDWYAPLLGDTPGLLSPLSNIEMQYRTPRMSVTNIVTLEQYLATPDEIAQIAAAHKKSRQGFLTVMALPFFCIKIPKAVYRAVGKLDTRFGRGGAEDTDYCLRCAARGIPVQYAANSWILHFNGKSTWAVETEEQRRARCNQFTEKFAEKWGLGLAELVLGHKSSVLEDPLLKRAAQRGEFATIVAELSRRDGITIQKEA